jgi:hypothetical protein
VGENPYWQKPNFGPSELLALPLGIAGRMLCNVSSLFLFPVTLLQGGIVLWLGNF